MNYGLKEISDICGGGLIGKDVRVRSVFTDSRSFSQEDGALFVAIGGRNHDGHAYINELYSRGIRAFIIDRDISTDKYRDAGFVLTENSVVALQVLAAHYRSGFKGTVVAVTGSNGKTVVKEWIASLVPPRIKLFRSPKSYNSQVGVPLSLLMMEGNEDVAVIEAGISMPGEMERLEAMIRPEIGIITTIGDAHQENFESLAEKAEEKLRLFRRADTVIYNSRYKEVTDALDKCCPSAKLVDAAAQTEVHGRFGDEASRENAAIAVTLCDLLGYDRSVTMERLAMLQPVAMRLELKEGLNDSVIVNDSYNSDINSLSIALDYLSNVAGGRRQTLILSDILQSGFPEKELYEKVAGLVRRSQVDRFIGIGERIKLYGYLFGSHTEFYPTTESYLGSMRVSDTAGRAILIKGNRGSQFERISHALERKSHTTTLHVDLDAMIHNLNLHRGMIGSGTKIMAMVKAAGYGHGTYEVASTLQHQGVDYLAVAFADEGVLLRERGITMPIVVLNADSDSFGLMIANSLEPEIYNMSSLSGFLSELRRYGERNYPIHIKLDTGMHRLGFVDAEIDALLDVIMKNSGLVYIRSVFSHLASSDVPVEDAFTQCQIDTFEALSARITSLLPYKPLLHIANSAAIERFPDSKFDMVRLGIGLYGVGALAGIGLKPVASLRTRIVQIKELRPNDTVGYGRAGEINKISRIATIPIGYADGLDRHLGNGRWSVLVGGMSAPTIGRVCMDTCMIDVTDIEAAEGDQVVIYGTQPGNTVEDMARELDTIPYEVMTSVSARVKRIYTKE